MQLRWQKFTNIVKCHWYQHRCTRFNNLHVNYVNAFILHRNMIWKRCFNNYWRVYVCVMIIMLTYSSSVNKPNLYSKTFEHNSDKCALYFTTTKRLSYCMNLQNIPIMANRQPRSLILEKHMVHIRFAVTISPLFVNLTRAHKRNWHVSQTKTWSEQHTSNENQWG